MASLTRRRMPAAKPPLTPCSVRSCRTVFKSSGSVRWVVMDLLWMCLVTPQQETIMARPRPVFCGGSPPSGTAALRLATLASAPPPPKGGWAEGRRAIYRTTFTPAFSWLGPYEFSSIQHFKTGLYTYADHVAKSRYNAPKREMWKGESRKREWRGRICRLAVVFSSIGGNRLDFPRAPSSAADERW